MKKSISPVVALALLLVTAVFGVVGFQSWYNDFSSSVLSGTETRSSNSVSQTGIDQVIGDSLYFKNSGNNNISIISITVDGRDCSISESISPGVSEFNIRNCLRYSSTTTPEIVVYTASNIFAKKELIVIPGPKQFVSIWNTSLSGTSASNQITLPLESGGTYNFTVNWGDGSFETVTNDTALTHTFPSSGIYTVTITGEISGWRFNFGGDRLKILEISEWGPLNLGNNQRYFWGASNLQITATDVLNLTGTTRLDSMFDGATSITTIPNMNSWDVSQVTGMGFMFEGATNFNENINSWDVSSVNNMGEMFRGATNFNQSLSNWDVSSLNSAAYMFFDATSFNGDISSWNTSNLVSMDRTFLGADSFNQDISNWDVSNVSNMDFLFFGADIFNQNLSSWNVSNVSSCSNYDSGATAWISGNKPNFTSCTP